MKTYVSPSQAVLGVLEDLLLAGSRRAPRGKETYELLNHQFKVLLPSSQPIETRSARWNQQIAEYTDMLFQLYMTGATEAERFAKASDFWARCSMPDGSTASAYGHLVLYNHSCGNTEFGLHMRTPWWWAVETLLLDPDSRQAWVPILLPQHLWRGSRDIPCTYGLQFRIIDRRLDCSAYMRSNDAARGLLFDMPWFMALQEQMVRELQSKYSWLKIGDYTHTAASMHIYEVALSKVWQMVGCASDDVLYTHSTGVGHEVTTAAAGAPEVGGS